MRSTLPKLRSRIRTAFRLAFLLRVDEDEVRASWLEVVVAGALLALAPTLYRLVEFGADGRFAWEHAGSILVACGLAFVASVVTAEALRRAGMVQVLLFAALLAWLAIDAVVLSSWAAIAQLYDPRAVAAYGVLVRFAIIAWVVLAFGRFAWGLRAASRPRRLLAAPIALLLFGFPLALLAPTRTLWDRDWSRDADDAYGDRWAAASEDVFYRQPDVLARELASVQPHRKGVVDVYFVGMAGYGYQDVFMREVDAVASLMSERFDAGGRIVKLVNNTKTLFTSPIASTTSLKAALKRIAAQMDVHEDVLVLFLTSHGSERHRFSLDLWPLRFNELDPAALRAILDESGIRNRVVIVSACYSGGFVEPLRDSHSLVIAAAAPDRNSFGCSNENEWTYFGKAYFDEALRKTYSFTGAFEAAAPLIEMREKAEDFDPSRPMMAAGDAIRARLALLEQQLVASEGRPRRAAVEVPAPAPQASLVDRYVELAFLPAIAKGHLETCRLNFWLGGPDNVVARHPEVFGGLDKRSPLWPRLVAAWDRHAEQSCARANEFELLRSAYAEKVREVMDPAVLAAAIEFLSSPQGRRWQQLDTEAYARQAQALAPIQGDIIDDSYGVFLQEQRRIYEQLEQRKTAAR